MRNQTETILVVHSYNGHEDDVKFVEIDGAKFVADETDPTKPKLDDKGEKIPLKTDDGGKGKVEEQDLEELAKTNPVVAKLLEDKKKLEADARKKAEDDKKKEEAEAAKKGEWQKLAEDRAKENEDLKQELQKKDTILGKYVGSTKKILDEMIKDIPEENRGLIPEGFSPREKLEYITKNAKLLGIKVSGAKGSPINKNDETPTATDEEKLVKEIIELQKKPNKTNSETTKLFDLSKKLKEIRTAKAGK